MGKQDMVLRGGMERRLAAEATSRPRTRVKVLGEEEGFSLLGLFISSGHLCAARGDLPAPAWGKRRGQSPEGGVDWCLDKVREEAELKEEDMHA